MSVVIAWLNVYPTDRISITPGIAQLSMASKETRGTSADVSRHFPFDSIVIRAANMNGAGARYFDVSIHDKASVKELGEALYYKVALRCADNVRSGKTVLFSSEGHVAREIDKFSQDMNGYISNHSKTGVFTMDLEDATKYARKYDDYLAFLYGIQDRAKQYGYAVNIVNAKAPERRPFWRKLFGS